MIRDIRNSGFFLYPNPKFIHSGFCIRNWHETVTSLCVGIGDKCEEIHTLADLGGPFQHGCPFE